jgi:hypothetical protein
VILRVMLADLIFIPLMHNFRLFVIRYRVTAWPTKELVVVFGLHASATKLVEGLGDVHLCQLLGVPFKTSSLLEVLVTIVLVVVFVCHMLWPVVMQLARFKIITKVLRLR